MTDRIENRQEELDWGDPRPELSRRDQLIALMMFVLYPLCFGSGILVAHFFHW